MEHRVVLTNKDALSLSEKLTFLSTAYIKDVYTGEKRIRTGPNGIKEKEYPTLLKGIIYRFSSHCKMGDIKDIWFEFKWTDNKSRFEIEFEGKVPEEFKNRPNISGWGILRK